MKKVLIVVDMQNDFIDGALGTKEAQAIVPKVIEKIKNFDGQDIIVTKDTHNRRDYSVTQEGRLLPVEHCIDGTTGWELNREVDDLLFRLNNVDYVKKATFGSTYIAETLKEYGEQYERIGEITLIGLCTDICVVSNAMLLKAFLPETKIIVDASCCAGVTPETHKAALTTMKMCQIEVIGE